MRVDKNRRRGSGFGIRPPHAHGSNESIRRDEIAKFRFRVCGLGARHAGGGASTRRTGPMARPRTRRATEPDGRPQRASAVDVGRRSPASRPPDRRRFSRRVMVGSGYIVRGTARSPPLGVRGKTPIPLTPIPQIARRIGGVAGQAHTRERCAADGAFFRPPRGAPQDVLEARVVERVVTGRAPDGPLRCLGEGLGAERARVVAVGLGRGGGNGEPAAAHLT